jgi:hypothetical protein
MKMPGAKFTVPRMIAGLVLITTVLTLEHAGELSAIQRQRGSLVSRDVRTRTISLARCNEMARLGHTMN